MISIIYHIEFKCQTVLFDPLIGPDQVLPIRARVDQGAIAMKGYSIFPKALGLEHHHLIVSCYNQDTRYAGVSPLYRDAVGVLHISISNFTQLDDFNYFYQTLKILFNINHLFAHSEEVTSIAI